MVMGLEGCGINGFLVREEVYWVRCLEIFDAILLSWMVVFIIFSDVVFRDCTRNLLYVTHRSPHHGPHHIIPPIIDGIRGDTPPTTWLFLPVSVKPVDLGPAPTRARKAEPTGGTTL